MSIPDVVSAVVAVLRADAGVPIDRVYYAELPKSEHATMPRKNVVVRKVGGFTADRARVRYQHQRIDIFCYGETPFEAAMLELAVYDALKQMVPHDVGTCRIWDAEVSSGAIDLREPDTQWPLVFRSYVIAAAEVAVA